MSSPLTERVNQPATQPADRVPRLLTVEEVQERLVAGRSTVFELMSSGALRSVKIGRRRVVSEAALIDYIERLEAAAAGDRTPRYRSAPT